MDLRFHIVSGMISLYNKEAICRHLFGFYIFLNKIKYEGMTINALGKLINYLNSVEEETFVKGQMVRFVNINEDTNFANDIYEEIAKGVYIYGYPRFN